jgi:hypothetical protein
VGSQLKKAHRTHALAQPAGAGYPHEAAVSGMPASRTSQAERMFAELCRRLPNARERAAMLGVSVRQDEAWQHGRQLPTLRAYRRAVGEALADLPQP